MTTKQIKQALKDGHVVSLKGDHTSMLYFDLFGDLVVTNLRADVPTRRATLADRRQAIVKDHDCNATLSKREFHE